MKEFKGILSKVGESTYKNSLNTGTNIIDTYSYIQIGDSIIKKLKVYSGINGELRSALGQEVTLYTKGNYLVGLKYPDGQTFASAGDNLFLNIMLFITFLGCGIPLSFVIIGLPILFWAWILWGRVAAGLAARNLPQAILI